MNGNVLKDSHKEIVRVKSSPAVLERQHGQQSFAEA